jgi:hypothetical protein
MGLAALLHAAADPSSVHIWKMNHTMDQISIKTPNPKCRLFLKIDPPVTHRMNLCTVQRWASTHANRSNARRRLKTLPSIGRSNRSSFFQKPKISVAPSISMFKKVYCRFKSSIFTPLTFFERSRILPRFLAVDYRIFRR